MGSVRPPRADSAGRVCVASSRWLIFTGEETVDLTDPVGLDCGVCESRGREKEGVRERRKGEAERRGKKRDTEGWKEELEMREGKKKTRMGKEGKKKQEESGKWRWRDEEAGRKEEEAGRRGREGGHTWAASTSSTLPVAPEHCLSHLHRHSTVFTGLGWLSVDSQGERGQLSGPCAPGSSGETRLLPEGLCSGLRRCLQVLNAFCFNLLT